MNDKLASPEYASLLPGYSSWRLWIGDESIAHALCLTGMNRPAEIDGNFHGRPREGKRDPAGASTDFLAHQRLALRRLPLICLCAWAMASIFALAQAPEASVAESKPAAPAAPQKLDEIRVHGTTEPEDRKGAEKTPLQKMREKLEKSGSPRGTTVKESTAADGTRKAQVDVGRSRFCIEQRIGQIDFSGIGKGGMAMKPMPGKEC